MPAPQSTSNTAGCTTAMLQDIGDALAVSNAWYRSLFDFSLNGILLVDPQTGRILAANPAACHSFGYTAADLCTLDRSAIIDTTDPRLGAALATRARTSQYRTELTFRHADGTLFPVEATSATFSGPDGGMVACVFFADITERQQLEEKLKFLAAIVESSEAAILSVDQTGCVISWNRGAERLYGYAAAEAIGRPLHGLIAPNQLPEFMRTAVLIWRDGITQRTEAQWVTKDGRTIDVALMSSPVKSTAGQIIGVALTAHDITAHRQAETALRIQHEVSRTLAASDDLQESLGLILDAALRIEGIDSGGIYLADPSGALNLVVHRGLSPQFVANTAHYAVDAPQARWARDGEARYGTYPEIRPAANTAGDVEGLRAIAVLPVAYQGELLAVLNLASHTQNAIPLHVRSTLETLALHGGSAVGRLRAAAAVRTNQQNLHALFDTVDDFLFVLDSRGRILRVNAVVADRLGYRAEELAGQDVLLTHPAERRAEAAAIIAAMLAGQCDLCAVPLQAKGGALIPVETRVTHGTWDGQPALIGISRDVTARLQAEAALRASEARFRTLFAKHNAVMLLVEPDSGAIVDANSAAAAFYGYSIAHLQTLNIADINMLTSEQVARERHRALEEARNHFVFPHRLASGEFRTVEVHSSPIQLDSQSILFSIIHDITPRWQAEAALRESEARWQFALEGAGDGVWDWDLLTNHVFFSRQWKVMLGYAEQEIGNTLDEWESRVHPDDKAECFAALARYFAGETPVYQNEHRVRYKDGTYKWILDRGKVIEWAEDGSPRRVIGTHTDISERRRQEEAIRELNASLERRVAERTAELQESNLLLEARVAERTRELDAAKQVAENANQAKSRFLANMSHELRTPLNAIVGLTQIMQDDPALNLEQRENLDIIVQSSEHLLSTINEVLDISKIEAGKMELCATDFDLRSMIRTLRAMLQQKAGAKRLDLIVDVAPNVPQYVHGDQGKLRQVLINLLNNAIKFTHQGGVALKVRFEPDHLGVFAVADTGVGIESAELNKLFGEFEQTASGRNAQEGTGLGLRISRKFVQLMNGDIAVTSEPGIGTTFTVRVPLLPAVVAQREAAELKVAGLAPGSPLIRVLVVDDIATNRKVLRQTLQPLGLELREAASGEEALAIWETWGPDLIWLDHRMRGMSGVDVARAIRQRETGQGNERTCIIALTASAFAEDQQAILAAGCDDIVAKPFRRRLIFDKMAEHLGLRYLYRIPRQPAARPTSANQAALSVADSTVPAAASSGARVLVVDDNAVGQRLAARLLQKLQVEVDVANNGAEALDALRAQPYAMVLMDMQMPVMSGIEATQCIRREWAECSPVIIALTASSDAEDYHAAQEAGVDGWLVKPLRVDDVRLLLERWLPRPAAP